MQSSLSPSTCCSPLILHHTPSLGCACRNVNTLNWIRTFQSPNYFVPSRKNVQKTVKALNLIIVLGSRQSLSMEGFSSSVILNTHLSQKVHSAPKPSDLSPAGLLALERCPPYFLCQTFGLLEAPRTSEENGSKQVKVLGSTFKSNQMCILLCLMCLFISFSGCQVGCFD